MVRTLFAVLALFCLCACGAPPTKQPASQSLTPAELAFEPPPQNTSGTPPTTSFSEAAANAANMSASAPTLAPSPDDDQGSDASDDRYFGQPAAERQAQATLPQSNDAVWRTLSTTRIHENAAQGTYSATHPPAVRALVGQRISVSGFVMPLETTQKFRHFLLTRYTPVCDFCPPGAPNEVIEVWIDRPITTTYNMVRVSGMFGLTNDPDLGLFFAMRSAAVEPAVKN